MEPSSCLHKDGQKQLQNEMETEIMTQSDLINIQISIKTLK